MIAGNLREHVRHCQLPISYSSQNVILRGQGDQFLREDLGLAFRGSTNLSFLTRIFF